MAGEGQVHAEFIKTVIQQMQSGGETFAPIFVFSRGPNRVQCQHIHSINTFLDYM